MAIFTSFTIPEIRRAVSGRPVESVSWIGDMVHIPNEAGRARVVLLYSLAREIEWMARGRSLDLPHDIVEIVDRLKDLADRVNTIFHTFPLWKQIIFDFRDAALRVTSIRRWNLEAIKRRALESRRLRDSPSAQSFFARPTGEVQALGLRPVVHDVDFYQLLGVGHQKAKQVSSKPENIWALTLLHLLSHARENSEANEQACHLYYSWGTAQRIGFDNSFQLLNGKWVWVSDMLSSRDEGYDFYGLTSSLKKLSLVEQHFLFESFCDVHEGKDLDTFPQIKPVREALLKASPLLKNRYNSFVQINSRGGLPFSPRSYMKGLLWQSVDKVREKKGRGIPLDEFLVDEAMTCIRLAALDLLVRSRVNGSDLILENGCVLSFKPLNPIPLDQFVDLSLFGRIRLSIDTEIERPDPNVRGEKFFNTVCQYTTNGFNKWDPGIGRSLVNEPIELVKHISQDTRWFRQESSLAPRFLINPEFIREIFPQRELLDKFNNFCNYLLSEESGHFSDFYTWRMGLDRTIAVKSSRMPIERFDEQLDKFFFRPDTWQAGRSDCFFSALSGVTSSGRKFGAGMSETGDLVINGLFYVAVKLERINLFIRLMLNPGYRETCQMSSDDPWILVQNKMVTEKEMMALAISYDEVYHIYSLRNEHGVNLVDFEVDSEGKPLPTYTIGLRHDGRDSSRCTFHLRYSLVHFARLIPRDRPLAQ